MVVSFAISCDDFIYSGFVGHQEKVIYLRRYREKRLSFKVSEGGRDDGRQ